ncbi:MAG: ABC-2 transporter permease [Peptostreptococcaceae bacterium]
MIKLIKKDLMTTLTCNKRAKLQYLFILIFLYTLLNPISYFMANIIISYMIVTYTFIYDEENNSKNFILSMPVSKEDIVYSKYILSFILIVVTSIINSIITWIIGGVIYRGPVLNDLLISNATFLIVMSMVLPIIFKFSYKKSKFFVGGIYVLGTLYFCSVFSMIADIMYRNNHNDEHLISYMVIGFNEEFNKLMEHLYHNLNTDYINLFTINIMSILIFVISLYISLKIVNKNKSNNRKFLTLCLMLFLSFGGYIFINKIAYQERIYVEDYDTSNNMEVDMSVEGYREVEEGLLIKLKIDNLSRYTYRLEDIDIGFGKDYEFEDGGSTFANYVSIELYEMDSNNRKIMLDGIPPNEVVYMTFLQPKGLKLENSSFDFKNTVVEYMGEHVVNIPIINIYTTISSNGGTYTIDYMNINN